MNCPHCHKPIPPEVVLKVAATLLAKRKRPGSKGQCKNPWGRAGKPPAEPPDAPKR